MNDNRQKWLLEDATEAEKKLVLSCAADAATKVLKPAGFKKERLNWRATFEKTIVSLNCQKSAYGGEFYINLYVHFRELADTYDYDTKSQINEVSARLPPPYEEPDFRDLSEVLIYRCPRHLDEKAKILEMAFERFALPFLLNFDTLPKAKKAIAEPDAVFRPAIMGSVYKFYNIPYLKTETQQ